MSNDLSIYSHVLKKVKENFKKKRKRWRIPVNSITSFENTYDSANNLLKFLTESFTDEDKEKYRFSKDKSRSISKE